MNVIWYMSDLHACGAIRGEVPAREINREFQNCHVTVKTDVLRSDIFGTDIMVFQRQFQPALLDMMKEAQARGIKCVYEIDDNMFELPPEFQKPYTFYSKPEVQATMTQYMVESDAMICSTPALAEQLQERAPATHKFIVRNSVDIERWERAFVAKQQPSENKLVIGWMASGSHMIDMPLISEALHRVMIAHPHVLIHFIGWPGFDKMGEWTAQFQDRIMIDTWVDISQLPSAMQDFDIGLAPIKDVPFNLAKSSLKALQYGCLGIPTIASPLAPYQEVIEHEKNGMFANSEDEWFEALNVLIEEETFRKSMGTTARLLVLDEHDIRNNCAQWVEVYAKIRSLS